MQMPGGHLLAAGLDGGNTIIFAKGKNVNESLPDAIRSAKERFFKESHMHRIFGTKENAEYFDREGVYLIPRCNSQVGVVRTPKGYFLLGGGLEAGESHFECLKRECLEEAGCLPVVEGKLCSAEAYVTHSTIGYFHPIQTYYFGKLHDRESAPTETDHIMCWMEYEQIKGKMFSEMQNWALEQFFTRTE